MFDHRIFNPGANMLPRAERQSARPEWRLFVGNRAARAEKASRGIILLKRRRDGTFFESPHFVVFRNADHESKLCQYLVGGQWVTVPVGNPSGVRIGYDTLQDALNAIAALG